jgi:hypothetical protein
MRMLITFFTTRLSFAAAPQDLERKRNADLAKSIRESQDKVQTLKAKLSACMKGDRSIDKKEPPIRASSLAEYALRSDCVFRTRNACVLLLLIRKKGIAIPRLSMRTVHV